MSVRLLFWRYCALLLLSSCCLRASSDGCLEASSLRDSAFSSVFSLSSDSFFSVAASFLESSATRALLLERAVRARIRSIPAGTANSRSARPLRQRTCNLSRFLPGSCRRRLRQGCGTRIVTDPNGGYDIRGIADEPGVFIVVRRTGLAGCRPSEGGGCTGAVVDDAF